MSGVLDISDRNGAHMRWLNTFSCTPGYCFWMDWGHQVKVAVNVTTVHVPITAQAHESLRCSATKNCKQRKGYCSYCCVFSKPRDRQEQPPGLPLPSAAPQSLPKNWAGSSESVSEAALAKHTQHRCCCPHCSSSSPAVRCQVWDSFTPQVCLFGEGRRLQYVTNHLTAKESLSRFCLWKTEHVLVKVIIWT